MTRFNGTGRLAWLTRLWRRSLQARTVIITVLLSGLAVSLIVGYMSLSIRANLFDSRRDQVLTEAGRAALQVQQIFDGSTASEQITSSDLEALRNGAQTAITRTTSSASGTRFALVRTLGQEPTLNNMQGIASTDLVIDRVISPEIRDSVAAADNRLVYQSVALQTENGEQPGIVVGTPIEVPTAGQYQLYLVYNLQETQNTLTFTQQTLAIGGLALVAMIGGVAWLVARFVVSPIRIAAETSRKLAAGQLEQRLPEKGDDDIATLARSFNAMADSLQSQITQLGTLSRLQQRFVSDVSHELRTPLTTIRLAGDVLHGQRDAFDPTTARTVELLHAQVQRFELLLADLLEMSRFDAGVAHLETDPTNLVRLAEDAIDSVAPLAAAKGSELQLLAPGGYFEADVDARRIRRILQNLLGNAIDHGEGKPIEVYVDSDENAVAIAVRDYGIGMSEAQVARVFDRFWRADPSRQRSTGGSGLGLAISLEDTNLHSGWLDVWSKPEEGSCFRLTLARHPGHQLTSSPLGLPPAAEDFAGEDGSNE